MKMFSFNEPHLGIRDEFCKTTCEFIFCSADTRYGERNGPESPKSQVSTTHVVAPSPLRGQLQQTRDLDNRQSRTASTATKELDDLMASLSDFKVNVSAAPTPSQARLSGDYAKPNKAKPASTPG